MLKEDIFTEISLIDISDHNHQKISDIEDIQFKKKLLIFLPEDYLIASGGVQFHSGSRGRVHCGAGV